MAERCILSFGSNGGPPMLPNYFYNNNYTIVQTPTHVMIHTEMVHDTRIITLVDHKPLPDDTAPLLRGLPGLVRGRHAGRRDDEHPRGPDAAGHPRHRGPPVVVERFTRADEHTINYEFTVHDPSTYEASWGGEVPFKALPGLVYEYACHEANYALSNVLSGARAQERENRDGQSSS